MKSLFTLVVSITAYSVMVLPSFAHDDGDAHASSAAFSQAIFAPAAGDHGAFSSREDHVATDPLATLAFDNFVLPGTGTYDVASIGWAGIYDEAFPATPLETSFEVKIYSDDASKPGTALHTYWLPGGIAGQDDGMVKTTSLNHQSPATDTSPGGGEAYAYEAHLAGVESLMGGTTYWASIQAVQHFDTVGDNDPIWQWHLGSGSGDGFYQRDVEFDPMNTPAYGIFQADKDLAFSLTLVPEPNSIVMAMFGLCTLGLIRRRR